MSDATTPATQQGEALRATAAKWLERIEDYRRREKTWLDAAAKAVRAYTGEGVTSDASNFETANAYDFNILFSNVETIVPAVINSPPAPDVRRRFGNDDPVAKDFAELLERAMRVQVDDGRMQVELEAMAQDAFLAGRGVIRIRYRSDFTGGETTEGELQARTRAADEQAAPPESVEPSAPVEEGTENERCGFEAVSWRDFAFGPAKRWEDVPWMAFRHSMPEDDMNAMSDVALVHSQGDDPTSDDEGTDREVWEVWDRKSKTVSFIAAGIAKVLKQVENPLGLSRFFPIATPVQPIEITGRLMPVNPFSIYSKLADELDTTTRRIRAVTQQLKLKGWYGIDPTDLQTLLDADDNEFIPVKDPDLWAQNGGLAGAIAFWPVEKLIPVLAELYKVRDQTKQAIYEITGISDIVRGASKSNETLGAQQIKAQWGSLRIQKMQRMMERAARDLFLMMAEIIPTKFSPATLQRMTDIPLEPSPEDLQPIQPPPGNAPADQEQAAQMQAEMQKAEQDRQKRIQHMGMLQALMRQPVATYYRIDVETDSTVKADLTRQKQEASEFMTAASGYFAAVGPLVQQGALPMELAVEIFSPFSRMFNLGKSVEDALDELVTRAKDAAGQGPKEDPAKAAAEADAQAKQAETAAKVEGMQADIQLKQQEGQIRTETARADIALKSLDQAAKRMDLQLKTVDLEIRQTDLALKQKQLLAPPPAPASQGSFNRG